MANLIDSKTKRDKLAPRREPYWARVAPGAHLGFRKLPEGAGTWIAKYRDPHSKKRQYRAIGAVTEGKPDAFYRAREIAEEWFTQRQHGAAGGGPYTVEAACRAYATACHNKSAARGRKADQILARTVFGDKVARIEVDRLRREDLEAWRRRVAEKPTTVGGPRGPLKGTPRAASTVNREIAVLRAALNLAHKDGRVASDIAWRAALEPTPNADGRRDIYLDRKARRALVGAAQDDLRPLIEALCLLPLRPGAMAALDARDYNSKTKTLRIGKDKAGADRRVVLPPQAAALFDGLVKGKLPGAPLFTRADGKRWNSHDWKRPVKAAVDAAGLPAAAVSYSLRHSTITDLVTSGLDLLTVAQISGTSVAMIEKHYGHLAQAHATAALEKLAL